VQLFVLVGLCSCVCPLVCASVTVGPASGVLKDFPREQRKPREVALTVLVYRCEYQISLTFHLSF
jgi:hypothetical protein